jgi:hypothetical protein
MGEITIRQAHGYAEQIPCFPSKPGMPNDAAAQNKLFNAVRRVRSRVT